MLREEDNCFVYLAYIDDSGTDAASPVVLCGGVVISSNRFLQIEKQVGSVIADLIPEERRYAFKEFHGHELFYQTGSFKDISRGECEGAIRKLLEILGPCQVPFVYSAVNRDALRRSAFGSSRALNTAFRMCVLGIQNWLVEHRVGSEIQLGLLIVDEPSERRIREDLAADFRELRARRTDGLDGVRHYGRIGSQLRFFHDGMYFGNSADSVGIQITDLCSYFMLRRLRGERDEIFSLLEPHAICARPSPFFDQCKTFLMAHDEA